MENISQEEKLKKAEEAAGKKAEKEFVIKVKNNPQYCGIGAGGIQFANGQAVTRSERMASWFREHDGYEVSEK